MYFNLIFLQEHTKLEGHAVVKDPQNNSFLAKFSRPSPTFTGWRPIFQTWLFKDRYLLGVICRTWPTRKRCSRRKCCARRCCWRCPSWCTRRAVRRRPAASRCAATDPAARPAPVSTTRSSPIRLQSTLLTVEVTLCSFVCICRRFVVRSNRSPAWVVCIEDKINQ